MMAMDQHPVGTPPLGTHRTNRIGQPGDVFDASRHGFDARRVERQSIQQRG
jgi:hypothetical protein